MHRMFCGYMGWWWESNVPRSSCLDKYDYHLNLTFNLVEYVLYIRASVILVTIIAITRSHIIFFRILPSHLTHAPSLFTYSLPTHLFLPFTLSSSSCPSLSRQCSRWTPPQTSKWRRVVRSRSAHWIKRWVGIVDLEFCIDGNTYLFIFEYLRPSEIKLWLFYFRFFCINIWYLKLKLDYIKLSISNHWFLISDPLFLIIFN